jgi:hypothetical protein
MPQSKKSLHVIYTKQIWEKRWKEFKETKINITDKFTSDVPAAFREKRGACHLCPKKTKMHQHNNITNPTKLARYQHRLNVNWNSKKETKLPIVDRDSGGVRNLIQSGLSLVIQNVTNPLRSLFSICNINHTIKYFLPEWSASKTGFIDTK